MRFKEWLLTESVQGIVSLGYPEIIAKLLYKRFGQVAPLIAKWMPESKYRAEIPKNWWFQIFSDYRRTPSLYDLTELYAAANNPETYKSTLAKIGIGSSFYEDGDDLEKQKKMILARIEPTFFEDYFFNSSIVKDIQSGKLTNLAPYKKLPFEEAQHKYDAKRIFNDTEPVKTYKNGFKWINTGKRCSLVASQMRNCGSAGLMSMDSGAVMIVLFGPENTAHVVVTYSPNENRISGDEGLGSTTVKEKYHPYILDLAKVLGANFDVHKTSATALKLKYMLQGKATGVRGIKVGGGYDTYYTFNMDGKVYYSDGYVAVSQEDVQKVKQAVIQGQIKLDSNTGSPQRNVLHYRNQHMLAQQFGIKYIPLNQLSTS